MAYINVIIDVKYRKKNAVEGKTTRDHDNSQDGNYPEYSFPVQAIRPDGHSFTCPSSYGKNLASIQIPVLPHPQWSTR